MELEINEEAFLFHDADELRGMKVNACQEAPDELGMDTISTIVWAKKGSQSPVPVI